MCLILSQRQVLLSLEHRIPAQGDTQEKATMRFSYQVLIALIFLGFISQTQGKPRKFDKNQINIFQNINLINRIQPWFSDR